MEDYTKWEAVLRLSPKKATELCLHVYTATHDDLSNLSFEANTDMDEWYEYDYDKEDRILSAHALLCYVHSCPNNRREEPKLIAAYYLLAGGKPGCVFQVNASRIEETGSFEMTDAVVNYKICNRSNTHSITV